VEVNVEENENMTDLLQKVFTQLSKLPDQQQDEYANWILSRLADDAEEAAWEAKVVTEALGDALREDGSIDFDKLRSKSIPITLNELYPEGGEDDEA
jgi:hypothetical protein